MSEADWRGICQKNKFKIRCMRTAAQILKINRLEFV